MPQKKKLSEPALRVLKTIADGNSVTGIRADLYEELRGLIGPNVPCLQNASPKARLSPRETLEAEAPRKTAWERLLEEDP